MINIGIIAPSFEGDGNSPQIALDWIKSQGWKGTSFLPPQGSHPVFASSHSKRLSHLLKAMENPEIDILWAIRGGGGATLLVPELLKLKDTLKKRSKPLTLMGFSDITALHVTGHQHLGWQCIHGPTLKSLARTDPTSVALLTELIDKESVVWGAPLCPLNKAAKNFKSLSAPLVGGNLSLINLGIGTPWQVDALDCVLVLEDVGEPPYRLALKLNHVAQAGLLDDVKALILGDFSATPEDPIDPMLTALVINEFADSLDLPVFKGAPIGHDALNHPFAQGSMCTLSADGYMRVEVNLK